MKSRITALSALAAVLSLACGGSTSTTPSTTTSSSPFNVLTVAAVSGTAGATGLACVNGAQAGALIINQAGGILGHKIVMKTYDTGGNQTQAVSLLVNALNSGTTWNFAWTGGASDEALAMQPTANKAKLLTISNNGSLKLNDPLNFPYHFGNSSNANTLAKLLVDEVAKKNFKKIALLTEDNAYGQTEQKAIGDAFKAANVPIVSLSFSATAVDLSPALLQLQSQGVDAVVWSALAASIGYVLKSRLKIGFMVPFIGDTGVSSADTFGLAGGAEAVANTTMMNWAVNAYGSPGQDNARFKTFIDTLHSVAVQITNPLQQYSACYDSMQAIRVAAEQAKSLDPDKLKDALESLKNPTPVPFLNYPKGHGWTKTEHFGVNTADQFAFHKPGPTVDGQVHPVP
jgi:branched-chain amino acid transport system substrate-binding protein